MSEKIDFRYRVGCAVFGLVFGLLFGFLVGLGCVASKCAADPMAVAIFGASFAGAIIGFAFPGSLFFLWEIGTSVWSKATDFFSKHEGTARLLEYLSVIGLLLTMAVTLITRG